MNTRKLFMWSLILMAAVAYKQMEGTGGTDPRQKADHLTYQSAH